MTSSHHVFNGPPAHKEEGKCSRLTRITRFFAEYASWMLGCGATCARISKNMERMAATVRLTVDLIILPSHVMVTVTEAGSNEGEACCHSHSIVKVAVSYDLITRLSKLSWDVAEKRITMEAARWVFRRLVHARAYNPWWVMLLVSVANASFCRLFGGDPAAMLIVAIATAAGYSLKLVLLHNRLDIKPTFIFCAFLSVIITGAACRMGLTATTEVALGTSVLYLIPGIPYINGVNDLIDGHYICAYSRFVYALLLTACIALGLTAGFLCMNLKIF